MAEYIREVEKVIDHYHKKSPVFGLNRKTALFHALTVFEDCCRMSRIAEPPLAENSFELAMLLREQINAVNVLIQWIFQDCPHEEDDILDAAIVPERYENICSLLQAHASPYALICNAYVSYSRGHSKAKVNETQKTITFFDNPDHRDITISDFMETILGDHLLSVQAAPTHMTYLANQKLISSIRFLDGHISYRTDAEVWVPIQNMMDRQWTAFSELPEEWRFDRFSVGDFKQFWVAVATLCLIHMTACLESGIEGMDIEEAVLVKSPSEFIQIILDKAKISADSAASILRLLIYNNALRNNDIIYQPFVAIDDNKLALAPHLILTSRAERNLVSLIHKIGDKSYFDLTNLREGIMQEALDSIAGNIQNVLIAKNRALPDTLPDVDYAIWDKSSNCILICELKWLVEADSTSEVLARIQDVEHGCRQITDILRYAENNCSDFCQRVFSATALQQGPNMIGCVVSKKGIRIDRSDIPVISLQSLINLLQSNTVAQAFEAIKKRTYLIPASNNLGFGYMTVKYAGYTFELPALVKK